MPVFVFGVFEICVANVQFEMHWAKFAVKCLITMGIYAAALIVTAGFFDKTFWPMTIATTALTAGNHVKEHAVVNVIMAVINIILELLLVPWFGIIGAAVAISFSYFFKAICMIALYKKYVNVKLGIFVKGTYIRLLPPIALALVAAVVEGHFIVADSWGKLVFKAVVIGISYIMVLCFLGLDTYEKSWIKNRFAKNK